MRKETAIRILSSLLILLFTYAALSKTADHAIFERQLKDFPMIGVWPGFFTWFIPLVEIITACFLLVPATILYGLYSSAILLFGFTVFLVVMLAFDKNLPCSCGGVISRLSWKQHIVFNLFFLALAVTGIFLRRKKRLNTQFKKYNSLS
jgi:hypothetical protein